MYAMPKTQPTRRQRRDAKEKKGKRLEVSFAVLLAVLPEAFHVPLVPYGLVAWVVALGLGLHLLVGSSYCDDWTNKEKLGWSLLVMLIVAVLTESLLENRWREEKAATLEGDLFLASSAATKRLVQVGEGGILLPEFEADHPFSIFADANVAVDNDNGHLLLSTVVRDKQGKEVVRLERNHWVINPDKGICLDKNYTTDALEVRDGRDHVVLQVRLYPDHISLQGEWFNDRGEDWLLVLNRRESKTEMIAKGSRYNPVLDAVMIEPIFQYPSDKHWAEWVSPVPVQNSPTTWVMVLGR